MTSAVREKSSGELPDRLIPEYVAPLGDAGTFTSGTGTGRTALHVCTRYQRGGSERRLRDSIAALPELRHEVLLGADSDAELARRQTGADRVAVLPSLVRPVAPARDLAALVALSRLLRRRDFAVVISHQSKAGVLTRLAAAAAAGPPAVHSLSMASFGPGYGAAESWLFARVESALGRRTAAFCVVGVDLADRFAALGIPRDRLHVVRSGVPLPAALPSRDEARRLVANRYGTHPGRPLVVSVGSLEPRKNPLLLPRLLATLRAGLPDDPPELLVLGDGPERAALTRALHETGQAAHAALAGHVVDPQHVHAAMRAADVLVLLSAAEGLPQVLVQAAAVGTPFVAFDVEGVRELLSLGACGTAVPPGDLDALATAARGWLAADGPGGREPVADLSGWSPDAITSAYRAVFGRLIPLPEPAWAALSA
jgi:glycosyltransferase involved in cell wall biosynthesis